MSAPRRTRALSPDVMAEVERSEAKRIKKLHEEAQAKLALEAETRRAVLQDSIAHAKQYAVLLPRTLTQPLANGVVNLMLTKILSQELAPRNAREAMEVAKVASEILRQETGEGTVGILALPPEERAAKIARAEAIFEQFKTEVNQSHESALAAIPGPTLVPDPEP